MESPWRWSDNLAEWLVTRVHCDFSVLSTSWSFGELKNNDSGTEDSVLITGLSGFDDFFLARLCKGQNIVFVEDATLHSFYKCLP